MPGKQGKGNRQVPWRDGGKGNSKTPEWLKRANHCLGTVPDASFDYESHYIGDTDKTVSERIYLYDQACSKSGITYYAAFLGKWEGFRIWAKKIHKEKLINIIQNIEPQNKKKDFNHVRGYWSEPRLPRIPAKFQDHPWVFQGYSEFAFDRPDNKWYYILLFRNKDRTIYGAKEWLGDMPKGPMIEKFIYRIITESDFRKEFLTEDPGFIEMWKRR